MRPPSLETLLWRQCIKLCISNNRGCRGRPCVARLLGIGNFLEASLCKLELHTVYSVVFRTAALRQVLIQLMLHQVNKGEATTRRPRQPRLMDGEFSKFPLGVLKSLSNSV